VTDGRTACLTFDFDALSIWLAQSGGARPSALSRGEFGARVGLGRILTLLERESVPATFYVPGHTVDTYPELCREIVERGHEIGHHGYLHESPADLEPAAERDVLERGLEAIERATGARAVGYRSPGWELSDASVALLLEYGFEYDSSMMAQDFELYYCRQGDVAATDGPYVFGPEVDLVEFPVSWSLDDYPQMEFVKSAALPGLSGYDKTLSMWTTDYDYMAENVPGGVFGITFHPQVIGRGGRMRILERLIAHIKESENVPFRRVVDTVRDWRAAHPLLDDRGSAPSGNAV
jgi:peptidoglycan/xylan/chitin deacetylase (PgdA/CDA1 family)